MAFQSSRITAQLARRRLTRFPAGGAKSGFSMIEVLIASIILVVAMVGAMGTLTRVTVLGEGNRESTIAYQAARSTLEQIQSVPFSQVFERFNDDPTDDPNGAGTAEGSNFVVAGLNARADDADGFCGRVLLPIGAGNTLLENTADARFGLPQDLNGDGVIDGDDHSDDKILLPIRIEVQWTGAAGDRNAVFSTILGERP